MVRFLRLATSLFRTHVCWCAQHFAVVRQNGGSIEQTSDSEIEDFDFKRLRRLRIGLVRWKHDHQVRRLEIAMDEHVAMRVLKGSGNIRNQLQFRLKLQRDVDREIRTQVDSI